MNAEASRSLCVNRRFSSTQLSASDPQMCRTLTRAHS